ncbi:MAG: AgmX/PglI C-terminal domain-containing protein [Proteobacteria bacterium]|nr:AgmX/PglI C-terminal domain-containing protein [Pseudomonadota bacterium]
MVFRRGTSWAEYLLLVAIAAVVFASALWISSGDSAPPTKGEVAETVVPKQEGPILRPCFDVAVKQKLPRKAPDEGVAEALDSSPAQPSLAGQKEIDWGAKVYLSNDDSMSLASAQRILYALETGAKLPISQIRPHELLNYFSFDTRDLRPGQLFSLSSVAEQKDDVLSLALSVKGAIPERQPLDLTLVVDRSGSMSAEGRMDYTKKGLLQLTDSLVDGDRVDVVLFESEICTPVEGFVVGRDDKQLLVEAIEKITPLGGTDLDSGLREAYRIQSARTDTVALRPRNRRVMLLTDAWLNKGNVDEDLVSEVGRQFDLNKIRLTAIGVGRDFNDEMLDKLTEKGKGAYVYLGSDAVVDRVFGVGFQSLTQTIAHDVRFALQLPDSLAMERFYGEEASVERADVQPIHYYAGTSQLFLQDLKIKDGELNSEDQIVLTIEYTDAASGFGGGQKFSMKLGELVQAKRHNVDKAQALMAFSDFLLAYSMESHTCGAALKTYRKLAGEVVDDAEIGYVDSLVQEIKCPAIEVAEPVKQLEVEVPEEERNMVADAVQRYSAQLRYCYDQRLKKNHRLEGRIEAKWDVANGKTSNVRLVSNTTKDPELGSCIKKQINRWKFPEAIEDEVSWPFVFRAKK